MSRMTMTEVKEWAKRNVFLVALVLVIFGGYALGKDAAFRDNARDANLVSNIR